MNFDKIKTFVVKNKSIIAVTTVAIAAVATVVIDVALRDNSPIEFENMPTN